MKRCKAFEDCRQPHICGSLTDCIWAMSEDEVIAKTIRVESKRDADIWNAAIEMAAKVSMNAIGYVDKSPLANHVGFLSQLVYEIRKLRK